jgi:hypothetical protein
MPLREETHFSGLGGPYMPSPFDTDPMDARSSGSKAVILPCEPDQFSDFIAALLGKPQTIDKIIHGQYELKKSDIENLYHLLDQRISSQNVATLVQFSVRILYDDSSSVLLNSFSDFESYNEVKPLISQGVTLSWTYLVKFNNKKFPEKQQIDIGFLTRESFEDFVLYSVVVHPNMRRPTGDITLRISHTDRSWGTDLQALLVGQLETLLHQYPMFRKLVRRYSGTVGTTSAIMLGGSLGFAAWRIIDHFKERALAEAKDIALANPTTIPELAKISKTTLNMLIANPAGDYLGALIVFGTVAFIGSVVFGVMVSSFAEATKPSFVLLTRKAKESRDASVTRDKNNWTRLLVSVGGAIVLSVIGNGVFYLILKNYIEAQ